MFGGFPFWSNGVLWKPLTQRLADEARGALRRETDKALLKSCLFLLTFSALASVGQSLPRETVALSDCPSGGPLCVAYKKETKPPNQLFKAEFLDITVKWRISSWSLEALSEGCQAFIPPWEWS